MLNYEFIENSVIMIPFVYKGYRLEGDEKIRFRCLFKTKEGDFSYVLDMTEDNVNEAGKDGRFTITLDMGKHGIIPGRYTFDLSLVLESGSTVTIKPQTECYIDVVPGVKGTEKR